MLEESHLDSGRCKLDATVQILCRVRPHTADAKGVIQLLPYSEEVCDAALLHAASEGVLPQIHCHQRCSARGIEEALRIALCNGHLHIADLLQPESTCFRSVSVPTDAYSTWMPDCLGHAGVVEWLLDRGASIDREIENGNLPAIRALCQLKRYHAALVPLLNHSGQVRDEALKALDAWSEARGPEGILNSVSSSLLEELEAMLTDTAVDYTLRIRAAEILARLLSDASKIVDGPLKYPDETCRALAIYCIGLIGDPSAISVLVEHLHGPMALPAIEALGNCSSNGGDVSALLPFVSDDDPIKREAACVALEKCRCSAHAAVIANLLDDEVPEVRLAAESALAAIFSE